MGSMTPTDGKPRSRAKKWRFYVSCGTDTTGKRIQRSKRFSGSLSEAKEALAKFETECIGIGARDVTFGDFCDDWLERRRPLIAPTTVTTKASLIKTLKQVLGESHKLSELTSYTIEKKLNGLLVKGLRGKPCSPTYVAGLYSFLSSLMNDAVRLEIIAKNPVDGIKRPNGKPPERVAPTIEEMQELIEILDPKNRHEMCILLNACLGLRRGEALGAQWGDIDLASKTIHIQRNLRTDGTLAKTKTAAGKRVLPLPDFLIDKLAIRRQTLELELRRNVKFGLIPKMPDMDTVTICANELGENIAPSTMSVWWGQHRAAFGLPNTTEHDLRHGYITLLAKAGVHPKAMQALAGHASPVVTLEVYSHAGLDDKRAGVDAFTNVLGFQGASASEEVRASGSDDPEVEIYEVIE